MIKLAKPMLLKAETKKPVIKKKEYIDLIEPVTLELDETASFVFSASKLGEDGQPHVDIRTWVDNERYSGPTKKGINFDIAEIDNIMEILQMIKDALVGGEEDE